MKIRNLLDRWEIIRRHPQYKEFCDKFSSAFDDDGFLDVWESLTPEPEVVMKLFGLSLLPHYKLSLTEEALIEILDNSEGVRFIFHTLKKAGHTVSDMFWDEAGRKVRLEIDISKPLGQLQAEIRECITDARENAGLKAKTPRGVEKDMQDVLRIWDLHQARKRRYEIMKEIWPEEMETIGVDMDDAEASRKYEELRDRYLSQGLEDYKADDRAWNDAYEKEYQGKLNQRITRALERMEGMFRDVTLIE